MDPELIVRQMIVIIGKTAGSFLEFLLGTE
jgi:hypothetical protein